MRHPTARRNGAPIRPYDLPLEGVVHFSEVQEDGFFFF